MIWLKVVKNGKCKNMNWIKSLVCVLLLACSVGIKATDEIVGVYKFKEPESKEDAKVKIFKTPDGKYTAQIIWVAQPYKADGSYIVDEKNPDPELRNTPVDKIIVARNLVYNAKKEQWDGQIYHPVYGKYFSVLMKFESPDKLKVRGYLGTPAMGQSQYWQKIE